MNLNLTRQNHTTPDFNQLYSMIKRLRSFLAEDVRTDDGIWCNNIEAIIRFQDKDGSFKLLDSFRVESDVRVDFCYMPTYICAAVLMKAFMTDADILERRIDIIARALKACCGRNLAGHGYDSLSGKKEALAIFCEGGLREFLMYHSDLCPEFTEMITEIVRELKESGEKSFDDYFSHSVVFVYGTLMAGERNHHYLEDNEYLGKAYISGFDMYDVGCFPAIVPGSADVKGELYKVAAADIERLDCLEGEGSLYIRECVPAKTESGDAIFAHAYIFNDAIDGLDIIPESIQPYTSNWREKTLQ